MTKPLSWGGFFPAKHDSVTARIRKKTYESCEIARFIEVHVTTIAADGMASGRCLYWEGKSPF